MRDATDFDLEGFLPYQLVVLSDRISRGFSTLYQQKFGISRAEWRVVAHLSQAGSVSVREIFKTVEMDKSKISRAASRLEAAGFVAKCVNPADRRLVELSLTEKVRAMMAEITPMAHAYEREVLAALTPHEGCFRAALAQLLEQT